MKKYSVVTTILLLLALVVCLNGCFGDNVEQQTTVNDSTVSDTAITDSELETETDSETETETEPVMSEVPIELYTVEIKQETLDAGTYTASLIYPQITGYSDPEIEEKVNALIYSYVNNKMNVAIAEKGVEMGVEYDIDSFNVTYKGDNFISALCRGSVSVDGDSYTPGFAYGINIDLKGAKLISFDGVVDYDGFKNDFSNGGYRLTRGYDKLLDETNFNDIISQYDPLYSIYPEFYIKQGESSLVFGVITDTVNVFGDVAEFEAELENKKYVKTYLTELTAPVGE